MRSLPLGLMLLVWLVGSVACSAPRAPAKDSADALRGPLDGTFSLPDHDDRDWLLHLPPSYDADPDEPTALVLGFHGGGGKKEGFNPTGCRDGDEDADNCMFAVADREGFAVVMLDGVKKPGLGGRSFHAGGGEDGFRCVGGQACVDDVDDVAVVDDLLKELRRALFVDDDRVFATGISNGGAMVHRLACDRSDVFAAVASVSGANQAETSPGCNPDVPIPVLHVHGTEDPCWGFDGTTEEPLCDDGNDGVFFGVDPTMDAWRAHNGCNGTEDDALPDTADDDTSTTRISGVDCQADTVLLKVTGGGHAWPDGWQYLRQSVIGRVGRDFSGNDAIWDFFQEHPRGRPTG